MTLSLLSVVWTRLSTSDTAAVIQTLEWLSMSEHKIKQYQENKAVSSRTKEAGLELFCSVQPRDLVAAQGLRGGRAVQSHALKLRNIFHCKQWQTVPYIPFLWHFPLSHRTSNGWWLFFLGVSLKAEGAGGKELNRQAEQVSKPSSVSEESVSHCWSSCAFFHAPFQQFSLNQLARPLVSNKSPFEPGGQKSNENAEPEGTLSPIKCFLL